jgi:hypothetical protein
MKGVIFMKIIAVVLNICALIAVGAIVADEGLPDNAYGWFICSSTGLCPIVNMIFILGRQSDKSWLGLYFKRKRLEKQKRIEALERDK